MLCLVGHTNVPVNILMGFGGKQQTNVCWYPGNRSLMLNAQESALLQAAQVAIRECTRKEHICGSDAPQNVCTISPIRRINLYTKAV